MSIYAAPKIAMRNKNNLAMFKQVGCYCCLELFSPNEITDFTDQGETALCPKCGVDAVLPLPDLNKEYLQSVKKYWID